jgi:hypothetical protein
MQRRLDPGSLPSTLVSLFPSLQYLCSFELSLEITFKICLAVDGVDSTLKGPSYDKSLAFCIMGFGYLHMEAMVSLDLDIMVYVRKESLQEAEI